MEHRQGSDARADEELVHAVAHGDADAFAALYDRHADAVYNYCSRRSGDITLAQDHTSSVFLEAWRCRKRFVATEGSALPWLFGIANNLYRSSLRAQSRARRAIARLPRERHEADIADRVAEVLDAKALVKELRKVIAQLPTKEAEMLALSLYGELSMVQIAAVCGVPVGTAKSRLSRLRSKIGAQLDAVHEEVPQ